MTARIVAELRDWVKIVGDDGRPSFQGRIFNDVTFMHSEGKFITIDAHDVHENVDGCLVYHTQGRIYALWNAHKRKPK